MLVTVLNMNTGITKIALTNSTVLQATNVTIWDLEKCKDSWNEPFPSKRSFIIRPKPEERKEYEVTDLNICAGDYGCNVCRVRDAYINIQLIPNDSLL